MIIQECRVDSEHACLFLVSFSVIHNTIIRCAVYSVVKGVKLVYFLFSVTSVGNVGEHRICSKHVDHGSLLPPVFRPLVGGEHCHQLLRLNVLPHHLGRLHLRHLLEQAPYLSHFRISRNNGRN